MAATEEKNEKKAKAKQRVHMGLLLDESGSMGGNEQAVIHGTNEFVDGLRDTDTDKEVLTTLAMFDLHGDEERCRVKYAGTPLDQVVNLHREDYRPRGVTPLNDAVVDTIRAMEKAKAEDDDAMLVIFTDGLENASETKTSDVQQLVQAKEGEGWTFIYLGANQDSWATADSLGMARAGHVYDTISTPAGTRASLASVAQMSSRYVATGETPEGAEGQADTIPEHPADPPGAKAQAAVEQAKRQARKSLGG